MSTALTPNPPTRHLSVLDGWRGLFLLLVMYALYVLHVGLQNTWLGSGDGWGEYVKRPLLVAVTWALAHFSTMTLEARSIALGRSLARRYAQGSAA
jgi:hypothetical protein